MNTQLKAKLETAIDRFLLDNCEDRNWPDGWTYDKIAAHMTNAAEAVFDAAHESSVFTSDQWRLISTHAKESPQPETQQHQ